MDSAVQFTPFDISNYIARQSQQRIIENAAAECRPRRTIVFYGDGGIGKSWLYQWSWHAMSALSGNRVEARLALDTSNTPLEWLQDLRLSVRSTGNHIRDVLGFSAFPRFDLALALYFAAQSTTGNLSPKLEILLKRQPWVEAAIDSGLGSTAAFALKMINVGAISASLGAVVKPLLSVVSRSLDQVYGRKLREEFESITSYDVDSLANLLPELLARDFNDLLNKYPDCGLIILIDGYEKLVGAAWSRIGINETDWLRRFCRVLDHGAVAIFSRFRIDWLDSDDVQTPSVVNEPGDEFTGMFDAFLDKKEVALTEEGGRDTASHVAQHVQLGLFSDEQVKQFLDKSKLDSAHPAYQILQETRLPWELSIKVKDAILHPHLSKAELDKRNIGKVLERILLGRSDHEIELINVLRFADDFSSETVKLVAYILGFGADAVSVSQILKSSFITSVTGRLRIEHHFAEQLRNAPAEARKRFNLASFRAKDMQSIEQVSQSVSVLTSALAEELEREITKNPRADTEVVVNSALKHIKTFRPTLAHLWRPDALTRIFEIGNDHVRTHISAARWVEAEHLAIKIESLAREAYNLLLDHAPKGMQFKSVFLRAGIRSTESLLEILALRNSQDNDRAFVDLVLRWTSLLQVSPALELSPGSSLERYWRSRLECRAFELAPEVRSRTGLGASYYRRLGSSLEGHLGTLNQVRNSIVVAGLELDDDPNHLSFVARSLLWSSSRWRRYHKLSEELHQEATAILERLAANPSQRATFLRKYAQSLVDARSGDRAASKQRLRMAIDLLEREYAASGMDFDLVQSLERGRTRLARLLAQDISSAGQHDGPEQVDELALLRQLLSRNIRDGIALVSNFEVPPVAVSHLFLKALRKASEVHHFDIRPLWSSIQAAFNACLRSLQTNPAATARSAHFELARLLKQSIAPAQEVISALDDAANLASELEQDALNQYHSALAAANARSELGEEYVLERLERASRKMASFVKTDEDALEPLHWEQQRELRRLTLSILIGSETFDMGRANLLARSLDELKEVGADRSAVSVAQQVVLRFGDLNDEQFVVERLVVLRMAAEVLKRLAVDDRRSYGKALEALARLDRSLGETARSAMLRQASNIAMLTEMDILAGSRLVAAEEAYESGQPDGMDQAIHLLFGAVADVEDRLSPDNESRQLVRRLWADLVWRRLANANARLRAERISPQHPPAENLDRLAVGNRRSFATDIFGLLTSLPRVPAPVPGEIAAVTFDRVCSVAERTDKDRTRFALAGVWRGESRCILRTNLTSPQDRDDLRLDELERTQRLRGVPCEENGDLLLSKVADLAAAEQLVAYDPGQPDHGQAGDAATIPAGQIPGDLPRIVSVLSQRRGGINVTARGIDHVSALIEAFAPLALQTGNSAGRVVSARYNSVVCAFVDNSFFHEIQRTRGWIHKEIESLLGLQRLFFAQASIKPGEEGIEEEIRSLIKEGFKRFKLLALSASSATFDIVDRTERDVPRFAQFEALFLQLFPGITPKLFGESLSNQASSARRFGHEDMRTDLNTKRKEVPEPGPAEVTYVALGSDGIRYALVRAATPDGDDTFILPRDVAQGSGLFLRAGHLLDCEYVWDVNRVKVSKASRRSAPAAALGRARIVAVDVKTYTASAQLLDRDSEPVAVPLGLFTEIGRPYPKIGETIKAQVADLQDGLEVICLDEVRNLRQEDPQDATTVEVQVVWFDQSKGIGLAKSADGRIHLKVRRSELRTRKLSCLYPDDLVRADVILHNGKWLVRKIRWTNRRTISPVAGVVDSSHRDLLFEINGSQVSASIPRDCIKAFGVDALSHGIKLSASVQDTSGEKWLVTTIEEIEFAFDGRWILGTLQVQGGHTRFKGLSEAADAFCPRGSTARLVEDEADLAGFVLEARLAPGPRGMIAISLRPVPWQTRDVVAGAIHSINRRQRRITIALDPPASPSGVPETETGKRLITVTEGMAQVSGVHLAPGVPVECLVEESVKGTPIVALRPAPSSIMRSLLMVVQPFDRKDAVRTLRAPESERVATASLDVPSIREYANNVGRHLLVDVVERADGFIATKAEPASDGVAWKYGYIKAETEDGYLIHTLAADTDMFAPKRLASMLSTGQLTSSQLVRYTQNDLSGKRRIGDLEGQRPSAPWYFRGLVKWFDADKAVGYVKLLDFDRELKLTGQTELLDGFVPERNAIVEVTMQVQGGRLRAYSIAPVNPQELPWVRTKITYFDRGKGFAIAKANGDLQADLGAKEIYLPANLIDARELTSLKIGDELFCRALRGISSRRLTALDAIYLIDDDWDGSLNEDECVEPIIFGYVDPARKIARARTLLEGKAVRLTAAEVGFDEFIQVDRGAIYLAKLRESSSGLLVMELIDWMGDELRGTPDPRNESDQSIN